MPDGVIRWFDKRTGELEVIRRGRPYRALVHDVESSARHPGARVHFDVAWVEGTERAVEVRLRAGTRVSPHQHRFGTLQGAREPAKGPAPYARSHPELRRAGAHPLEVARAWASALEEGVVDEAIALYGPDAVVHAEDRTIAGRAALEAYLATLPVLGSRRRARIEGLGDAAVVSWESTAAQEPGLSVRSQMRHGEIAEQWVWATPALTAWALGGEAPSLPLALVTKGEVADGERDAAARSIGTVLESLDEPVLFARLKLIMEPDPARPRPAVAQVAVDLNGDLVRAQVTARTMPEAVDRLHRRLRDRLEHRAQRLAHLRRTALSPEQGEWRHGDLPSERPPYFDRPPEERALVRHKTFAVDEMTPDEAVFDMEQLDFDFYLFCDLETDADAFVERVGPGRYRLTRTGPEGVPTGVTAVPIEVSTTPVPTLDLTGAVERLDATGQPAVFFTDATSGRGNVLYRRYDGHYGLLVPE